jgi:hypothetical protein
MLYHYQDSIKELSNKQVVDILQALEKRLRTGKFRYHGDDDSPSFELLRKAIQSEWPQEVVAVLRQKGKEMAAGKPMTPALGVSAVLAVIKEAVAPRRAKLRDGDVESEVLIAEAEARLALLFGKAPSLSEKFLPREYGTGKVVSIKPRSRADRLIVDAARAMEADTYILALYNKDAGAIRLLGWATRQDLKPGEKDSLFLSLPELKPMSEFLWNHKVLAVPEGLLFDQVPDAKDLPLPLKRKNLSAMLSPATDDGGADFWEQIDGKKPEQKSADVF